MLETDRLLLREYTLDDFDALYEIMSDPETMQHYPAPFDEARTRRWIEWNLENYAHYGFGLWAVVLKETGEFIGDCGITIQNIDGEMLPEIGYHIHKKYWRRGFAKEAAQAVRDWVFKNTDYDTIYSYMKYTNVASYSTAVANGMKKFKEYPDPKNTISYAYAITRKEWEELRCTSQPVVRNAELADAKRLVEIYDYYVRNTAITFEYDTPSADEFKARMEKTMKRYPYLVIEKDGRIEGYAYAGVFKDRAAYDWSCETTIYIEKDQKKNGMGRMLYEALEKKLKEMGIRNLYACIGYPETEDEYLTKNSAEFHAHLGYTKVGEFHKCGYKFGRWYNMIWMEKIIGE